jgi:MFS transporter, ACS family, glucarate transporter
MKHRNRVLVLLSLLSAITYLDRICISVAGPRMQNELHISPHAWGWVGSVFAISYSVFEIPGGYMGDRWGARLVLTRIVLWWSAFTSLTGTVSRYSSLLLTRLLFGAGEAGAFPNASASIFRWFPAAERSRAFGVVLMSSQIGGALSPLLVVPIQTRFGWRMSFYAFGIVGALWAAFWWWWYRNTPREKAGVKPEELAEVPAVPAVCGHSLPWGTLAHSSNLWAVMALAFAYLYVYYFFLFWLDTYLVRARGFSERGLMFSTFPFILGGAANFCGGLISDVAARRWGAKWGRRIVGVVGLASASGFLFAAVLTADKYLTLLWLALCYSAITFQQPTVWAICITLGKHFAGSVSGCMNTAANLGAVVSMATFGYLVERFGSYDLPLMIMAVLLLVATALWLRIDATEPLIS